MAQMQTTCTPRRGLNIKPRWEEKDDMMLQAENMAEMVERTAQLQASDNGTKVHAYNHGQHGSQSLGDGALESQTVAKQHTSVADKAAVADKRTSKSVEFADSGGDSNSVSGTPSVQENKAQEQEHGQEQGSGTLGTVEPHDQDVHVVSKGGVSNEK
jgi:hypothetical protein